MPDDVTQQALGHHVVVAERALPRPAHAGDLAGICDACPLRGGVTTEDEMFILLGAFYIVP